MKKLSNLLFRIISLSFSLILLVAALLGTIELAEMEQELTEIESKINTLKEENRLLQAQYESCMSLEDLERYALDQLGMQRLSPGQIIYIDLG